MIQLVTAVDATDAAGWTAAVAVDAAAAADEWPRKQPFLCHRLRLMVMPGLSYVDAQMSEQWLHCY